MKRIAMHLTEDEHAELLAAAKLASMPLATFIRAMALKLLRDE